MTGIIGTLTAITGLIVLALTGLSYAGQKRFYTPRPESLTIRLTGHQWWWEARYEDARPSRVFTTANEIHIPAGERVTFQLASSDVIHSFWVPNLAGKMDLIPGVDNRLQLVADRPGTYRGQCAEFCGYQHAHMGLIVVAEPKETFDAWHEAQLRAASPPADEESRKGQSVFLSRPCVACHTIRGTTAGGRIGPDLTHLGSRMHLASATLPLTRGALGAWIIDPQTIKPGVHMPMTQLQPEEIDPLLTYLTGLK
jgi:cytochrome c oxidase subunit 2